MNSQNLEDIKVKTHFICPSNTDTCFEEMELSDISIRVNFLDSWINHNFKTIFIQGKIKINGEDNEDSEIIDNYIFIVQGNLVKKKLFQLKKSEKLRKVFLHSILK